MYAALGIIKNSNHSGELIGAHQKIDKSARLLLGRVCSDSRKFPNIEEILYFEGSRGPDGLKRKSPGEDELEHFIQPDHDDGVLAKIISDHQANLTRALIAGDRVRASFEAAWMAHAITDGLTPAHHYPYRRVVDELMTDKDYLKLFGAKIKGIMRGENMLQAARNNWLYWGAGGVMTKHIAFEYGVAYMIAPFSLKRLWPIPYYKEDFQNPDCLKSFYASLDKVAALKMYDRFLKTGWTTQLVTETREILIPEIVRAVTLAWASSLHDARAARLIAKKGSNAKE